SGISRRGGVAQPETANQPGALAASPAEPNAYFVDKLFRSERPVAEARDASVRAEASRIFAKAMLSNPVPSADQKYLSAMVAARTGISQPEAERRVSDVLTEARQTEDAARKVAARLLLWFFVA